MSNNKKDFNQKISFIVDLESKLNWFCQHEFVFLTIVIFIGILIRLYYFPLELPFTLDVMDYFAYAVKTSHVHNFPKDWALANNGWPGFVAIFFSFINSSNMFDYIYLQRVLSIIISVLTVIPIYLLCRRFFEKTFALFGATLFLFEPRIIQNSFSGGNVVPFIFLGATTLFLFLSDNRKVVYSSFATLALFSLVRYEGLLLIIPLSILFFYRYRKENKVILHYLLAFSLFMAIIFPMAYIQIENTGQDGLTSHVLEGSRHISSHLIQGDSPSDDWTSNISENRLYYFIIKGWTNLFFYLGLSSVPLFFIFIPYGIFRIFKEKNSKGFTIILTTVFLLIPVFYVYARDFQDIRYLFILYPIAALLSVYTFKKIGTRIKKPSLLLVLLTVVIIITSLTFLEYTKMDYEYERDTFKVAQFIVNSAQGVNAFSPESEYLKSAELAKKWPTIPEPDENGHIIRDIQRIFTDDFSSLDDFIRESKNDGLTHLVIDGREDRANFLNDVYYNEEKYPYLIKIYDSADHGLSYHVKIYKIDYDLFENSAR